jgi:hypothetical protein
MKRTYHSRGAAMMEAVVLMPVLMCVFFASIYIKQVYDHRLALQNGTHKQSSEAALAGCDSASGGGTGLITGCSGGPNLGLAEAIRRDQGSVSAKAGKASVDGASSAFNTQNIKANSTRLCDEKPTTGLMGMFETGKRMLTNPTRLPDGDVTQGKGCQE